MTPITKEDLDAIRFASVFVDEGTATEPEGEVDGIDVSFKITKAAWTDALSDPENAAVLLSWIEDKRG